MKFNHGKKYKASTALGSCLQQAGQRYKQGIKFSVVLIWILLLVIQSEQAPLLGIGIGSPIVDTILNVASPQQAEQQRRSVQVPPIVSRFNAQRVLVPSHYLTILDKDGGCILPSEKYCQHYEKAEQDPHVDQSLMLVLHDRCSEKVGSERPIQVWDFGANVGYYTTFMRAMGCSVVAIEPQPAMNVIGRNTLKANGWDTADGDGSVKWIEKGVSNAPGKIKLSKLWQPGNKNAGTMTVDTVTITELRDMHRQGSEEVVVVDMLKLDIDGPEILSLVGIMNLQDSLTILNLITELTVKSWSSFGFSNADVVYHLNQYFDIGYRMLLVMATEFKKYPAETMLKLKEVKDFGELTHAYEIPKSAIGEVLFMANKMTKNIFMSKDSRVLAELDKALMKMKDQS